jgi:hypothetical protein
LQWGASILVPQNNFIDFSSNAHKVFEILNKWFKETQCYIIFVDNIPMRLKM